MPRGRACKICELKKTNQKAYDLITEQIKKNEKGKMSKFLRELNKEYKINIISMNVQRHRAHSEVQKKSKEQPAEMQVYSKEGELIYTNINEIIEDLEPKHKLFCEEYTNTFNHNATAAYMNVFDSNNYRSKIITSFYISGT